MFSAWLLICKSSLIGLKEKRFVLDKQQRLLTEINDLIFAVKRGSSANNLEHVSERKTT
jgi:hypothetical protein